MMTTRTFDWRLRHDPRSLNYRIKEQVSPALVSRIWTKKVWLDQGQEGACTGFGTAHTLASTSAFKSGQTGWTDEKAEALYKSAQKHDEWPGEDYDGSSVLGAMKAAKAQGLIKSYSWATTLDEILSAVSSKGPVTIGVNWYEGMYDPDATGFLHATGQNVGGHCLEIIGNNVARKAVLLANSWGKSWGMNGTAWLSWDDLDRLRREQGEFALPVKK